MGVMEESSPARVPEKASLTASAEVVPEDRGQKTDEEEKDMHGESGLEKSPKDLVEHSKSEGHLQGAGSTIVGDCEQEPQHGHSKVSEDEEKIEDEHKEEEIEKP